MVTELPPPLLVKRAMKIGCERDGVGFVGFADVEFADDVSIGVEDHDVVSASDEDVVRRRIDGEIVPSTLAAENDLLEQVILRSAGILRGALGSGEGCDNPYGEQKEWSGKQAVEFHGAHLGGMIGSRG